MEETRLLNLDLDRSIVDSTRFSLFFRFVAVGCSAQFADFQEQGFFWENTK